MSHLWQIINKQRGWLLGLAVLVLLWALAPWALKHAMIWKLQQQTQAKVAIEQVALAWWDGRVTVSGLSVTTDETPFLSFERLHMDLSWGDLWDKNWLLQRLRLQNAELVIELGSASRLVRVAGVPIAEKDAEAEPAPGEKAASFFSQWGLGVQNLDIDRLRVIINTESASRTFHLHQIDLSGLQTWTPDSAARLTMDASLTQAQASDADISLELVATPFATLPAVSGTLDLSGLDLSLWQGFLSPDVSTLEGLVSADGHFAWQRASQSFDWDGDLTLGQLRLASDSLIAQPLLLTLDRLNWSGKIETILDSAQPQITGKGQLSLREGMAKRASQTLAWRSLNWQGSWQTDADASSSALSWQFHADHRLEIKQGDLQSDPGQKLRWDAMDYEGQLSLASREADAVSLEIDQTRIDLSGVEASQAPLTLDLKGVRWEGQASASLGTEQPQLDSEQTLQLDGLAFTDPSSQVALKRLNWKGRMGLAPNETDPEAGGQWQAQGDATVTRFSALAATFQPQFEQLHWQGRVSGGFATDQSAPSPIISNGHLSMTLLTLASVMEAARLQTDDASAETGPVWASLDSLASDYDIEFSLGETASSLKVSLAQIEAQALSLSALKNPDAAQNTDKLETWLTLNAFSLPKAEFHQADQTRQIRTETATLKGGKVTLDLHEGNQLAQWRGLRPLLGLSPSSEKGGEPENAEATDGSPSSSETLSWRAEGAKVIDLKVTLRHWVDGSPIPTKARFDRISVGPVDQAHPDLTTAIALSGKLNEQALFDGTSEMTLLAPLQETRYQFEFNDLDLYSYSPLIKQGLGLPVQRGRLSMESEGRIQKAELESKNTLRLNGFQMGSAEGISGFSSIKVGLNLLKDKNNRVELNMPIHGRLDSPEFRLNSVIQTALFKAVRSGTKTMLTLTLQPYGAIYLAAKYAFDKATAITFEPVVFEPGKPGLSEAMRQYLGQVAEVVQKQSDLLLNVCGYFTETDRAYWTQKNLSGEALEQKLMQLAKRRQEQVETYLMKTEGVSAGNMTLCQPQERALDKTGVLLGL
ncbi:MAG: DUF748 domain-containing protein [Hydrogenovibrio sp.]|uniref:DUF748 domain-containing protein n=1 Tax=Hydrogenovibrio sp. TaxID=2065821 RepID=UPI00286FCE6A|nr:DUF748 domain-containing protein [Hydrogenovibrio sp.]MDR9498675.1 DUF748 domain-containing protein [Hydrogenovibrio sp.]